MIRWKKYPNIGKKYIVLSEANKHQKILINEGIREYFRYIKNEFVSKKELIKKVDNNRIIYSKAFDKLRALKDSTFRQDISTWGLNSFDIILIIYE